MITPGGEDSVSVSFDRAYAERLLANGTLGDSERFRSAVPDADEASGVIYADLDAGRIGDLVAEFLDLDPADIDPLSTVGMTDRTDSDGYVLDRIRVSFD